VLFFIVHAAVIPTNVFPAPHGNTIMPDLARLYHNSQRVTNCYNMLVDYPFPNILERLFSWYGLILVVGFKSIGRFGFTVSFLKSYSSNIG
jgi:hypothetical protein